MSPKAKQDLVISGVLYAFSAFVLFLTRDMMKDSAMFPRMIVFLILLINTINVVMIIRNDRQAVAKDKIEPLMLTMKTAFMPLVTFAGVVAYVILFAYTNYFIATAVMLIVFMFIEKVKPKWLIFVITAVYLAFIYYLFVVQLSVRLIH